MNGFDIGIILFVVLSALLGYFSGFIWQIATLVSTVLGSLAAIFLSAPLSSLLQNMFSNWSYSQRFWSILSFILVFFAVSTLIRGIASLIKKFSDKTPLKFFDRLLGTLLGAAKGGLIVIILILVLVYYPTSWAAANLKSSKITPVVVKGFTYLTPVMSEQMANKVKDFDQANPEILYGQLAFYEAIENNLGTVKGYFGSSLEQMEKKHGGIDGLAKEAERRLKELQNGTPAPSSEDNTISKKTLQQKKSLTDSEKAKEKALREILDAYKQYKNTGKK